MAFRVLVGALLSSLVFLGACGGDDGDAGGGAGSVIELSSCAGAFDDFVACGGSVEGTWTLRKVCTDFSMMEGATCPDSEAELRSGVADGSTITFENGRAVSPAAKVVIESEVRFPLSCIEGQVKACGDLSIPMFGHLCTGADVCNCVTRFEDEEEPLNGSYTVDGTTLILEEEGEEIVEYEFCVRGDQLLLQLEGEEGERVVMAAQRR